VGRDQATFAASLFIKKCCIVKNIIILLIALIPYFEPLQAQQMVQLSDLEPWKGLFQGSLTYMDYTSNDIVPMAMVAAVSTKKDKLDIEIRLTEWGGIYKQHYSYTFKNGTLYFNGAWDMQTQGVEIQNGVRKAVFTKDGKDGNEHKPCTFRLTFSGTADDWSIRKEVKFKDGQEYFTRNVYTFTRVESKAADGFSQR
jgi:hypothetical protein